jgi:hypothetical protein
MDYYKSYVVNATEMIIEQIVHERNVYPFKPLPYRFISMGRGNSKSSLIYNGLGDI